MQLLVVGCRKQHGQCDDWIEIQCDATDIFATILGLVFIYNDNNINLYSTHSFVKVKQNCEKLYRFPICHQVVGTKVYEERRAESFRILKQTDLRREKIQDVIRDIETKRRKRRSKTISNIESLWSRARQEKTCVNVQNSRLGQCKSLCTGSFPSGAEIRVR